MEKLKGIVLNSVFIKEVYEKNEFNKIIKINYYQLTIDTEKEPLFCKVNIHYNLDFIGKKIKYWKNEFNLISKFWIH